MPCVKRKLLLLALTAWIALAPSAAFASYQSCECFCGIQGAGATSEGAMESSTCQEKCADIAEKKPGTKFVGCFTDPQFYPDRNPKCWTQDACSEWKGYNGITPITAEWGDGQMPYDCAKTKTSQQEQHYCYPEDAKYTLNVPIGSISSVDNLPAYINGIYTWLLPAAALIAVVMMMLGGLQYVMSRGKEKYITKGKDRITNAITGLVILLSIFVILNIIDPRLTVLNSLKLPMMKEVTLLDVNSSCERLEDDDVGYKVDLVTAPESCGGTGRISDSSGLVSGAIGSWKEGDLCEYMKCTGADEGKVCMAEGTTKVCKSCADVTNPTPSSCSALSDTGPGKGTQLYCEYDSITKGCMTPGEALPRNQGINCAQMKVWAAAKSTDVMRGVSEAVPLGCRVYERLTVARSLAGAGVSTRSSFSSDINSSSWNGELLKKVCEDDFCGVADYLHAITCEYTTGEATDSEATIASVLDFFGVPVNKSVGHYCNTF